MKVHMCCTCVVCMIYTWKCTCVAHVLHHDLVGKFYSVFHMCYTCATHVWHMCRSFNLLTHEIHMCPSPMLHMCSFGKGVQTVISCYFRLCRLMLGKGFIYVQFMLATPLSTVTQNTPLQLFLSWNRTAVHKLLRNSKFNGRYSLNNTTAESPCSKVIQWFLGNIQGPRCSTFKSKLHCESTTNLVLCGLYLNKLRIINSLEIHSKERYTAEIFKASFSSVMLCRWNRANWIVTEEGIHF